MPVTGLIVVDQQQQVPPTEDADGSPSSKEKYVVSPLSGRRYLLSTLSPAEMEQVTLLYLCSGFKLVCSGIKSSSPVNCVSMFLISMRPPSVDDSAPHQACDRARTLHLPKIDTRLRKDVQLGRQTLA